MSGKGCERRMIWFLGTLLSIVAAFLGLTWALPNALGMGDAHIKLAYGLILLTVLFSSVAIAAHTHHLHRLAKSGMAWLAVSLAVMVVYTYEQGFRALAEETFAFVDPAEPQTDAANGSVTIRASSDGHFLAVADVNGKRVRFLIDTGASEVVLTKADARRIGIDIDNLSFIMPVTTANGVMYVAPVRIKSIQLGPIKLNGINAQVAGDGLSSSLLGMSYLRRLTSYEFSRQELTLKE
jgi:aspartyl protease family protein